MGKTIAEKILGSHSDKDVSASELVLATVDLIMGGSEWNTALTAHVLKEMEVEKIFDPAKAIFVIDHAVPSPNEQVSALQAETEEFCKRQGAVLYYSGEGICNQLLPERGHVLPGMLVVGGDSHVPTYGALNAFSVGVGSTDVAAALASGQLWFNVPQSIKIELRGCLANGVSAKDVSLHIIGQMTAEGAGYKAVEFTGEGINCISMDGRLGVVAINETADLRLAGTIVQYQVQPVQYNNLNEPIRKRLRIIASIKLFDLKKSREIFYDGEIQAFETFSEIVPPVNSEHTVQERVIETLARRISVKVIDGWYTDLMTGIEKGKKRDEQ